METVYHTFGPVYFADSRVLILGSIPSPKSREIGFYYGHPQNRFWRVMEELFSCELQNKSIEEKIGFLHKNKIALWDVLKQCDIQGASDSSIRNPIPNPLEEIIQTAKIQAIFATGTTAGKLYQKYCASKLQIPCQILPSTSPANCRYTLAQLAEEYKVILQYL